MEFQHEFTFRWERVVRPGNPIPSGWATMSGDSSTPGLDAESLRLAKETIKRDKADVLECHPSEIVVFLVNHTVVTA